jgi:hypothetical protein
MAMSEEIILRLNLQYLLQHKSCKNNIKEQVDNNHLENIRFYKKRIYDITKRFMKLDNTDEVINLLTNSDVKLAFDNYAKLCIHYFQMTDLSDIYQEGYEPEEEKEELNEPLSLKEDATTAEMYKKLFFKPENNLETIVMRKVDNSHAPAKELPIQRDINLKVPELKKKGIKKRKDE